MRFHRTAMIAVGALAAALWMMQPVAGQKEDRAEVLLRAAIKKELVDGDLKAAIEQYKQIVVSQSGNRPVAAKALLQMGQCYEKLGHAEARKAYERIVNSYSDQQELAARARVRLASLRERSTTARNVTSFRRLSEESQLTQAPAVSYDGRYMPYQSGPGSIMVRELATGKDYTLVTQRPNNDAEDPVISRDGEMVAYTWYTEGRYELRTIPVRTASPGQPRQLFRSEDVSEPTPFDWSPDGTRIAVHLRRDDGTSQIGLVSTADGSLKVLKSVDWHASRKTQEGWSIMSFSPDGKYLAYDDLAADDNSGQRDVFVMAVDGSRDIAAVVHPSDDTLAGCSPDGKQLLFFSNRTGSRGLWSQPVVDGRPQGAAALIKADLGSSRSLGITASGALYLSSMVEGSDIEVVSVDFATGQMVGSPVKPITDYIGANSQPEWSSDGKFMSYVTQTIAGRQASPMLRIRELATGKVRGISLQLSTIYAKAWSPDGKFFALGGMDLKGRGGLFLVDAETGEASLLLSGGSPVWSPDGKKLYYRRRMGQQSAFFERDMASGVEREIIRRPRLGSGISLSPDGRWIATMTADTAGQAAILFPASGGQVRELMRTNLPSPLSLSIALWAPDSNSVIVKRGRFQDRWLEPIEYWQVPISGGEPRKTDLKIDSATSPRWTWPRLHPDGRQVAYVTGQRKEEVWVLENFLPASTASK